MKKKIIASIITAIVITSGTICININAHSDTYYKRLPLEYVDDGYMECTDRINTDLQRYINNLCEDNIPPELIYAIMWRESRYISNINNKGLNENGTTDYGIMQINDSNFGWLAERTGLEVNEKTMCYAYTNVACGLEILKINMEYFRQQGFCGDDLLYASLMGYGKGTRVSYEMIKNGIRDEQAEKAWTMYKYILNHKEELTY